MEKAIRVLALCLGLLMVSLAAWPGSGYIPAVSAAQFTYQVIPPNGSSTQVKRPEIRFQLNLGGERVETCELFLDGQPLSAAYNAAAGVISAQPAGDLAPGWHTVSLRVQLAGYQPFELTSTFTITSQSYQAQPSAALAGQASLTADGLKVLNGFRQALGLPLLTEQPKLMQSAQAHADFLARNRLFSHYQSKAYPGFTGIRVKDRAEAFGYYLPVGEGLSTVTPSGGMGVESLMDAPYHRLAHIDPNFSEAGLGFSLNPSITVVNYGAPQGLKDNRVVLYPYSGQTDAKIGWKAVEDPNPLAAYGQENAYVGYPISLSVHDSTTKELQLISAQLTDAGSREVPVYVMDSSKETSWKKHVFLIPQKPLTPGMAYTAKVEAIRLLTDGTTAPISRKWTFTTLPRLELLSATLEQMDNGAGYVAVRLKNGDIADLEYTIKRGSEVWQTYQGERYLRHNLDQPMTGKFILELSSRLFSQPAVYQIEITGTQKGSQIVWQ